MVRQGVCVRVVCACVCVCVCVWERERERDAQEIIWCYRTPDSSNPRRFSRSLSSSVCD